MSLLSYIELLELQRMGVIRNSLPEHVNSSSIDLTLGATILYEVTPASAAESVVSLRQREPLATHRHVLSDSEAFYLHPGEFILAHTQQEFWLPNDISAEYKLKSSMARVGLEHLTAGWADAGWHGSVLTLELKNMTRSHVIALQVGDRIGQVVFYRHAAVPAFASYAARGRYNGDKTVSEVKP